MTEANDRWEQAKLRLGRAEKERKAAEEEFRAARDALLTEISRGDTDLTKRELEIRELVKAGKANKEIAKELNITERAVKFHVSNILAKFHVGSRYKL